MRELPIIYSKAMVLAKMAGRKTMTRRTVGLELINSEPERWEFVRTEAGRKANGIWITFALFEHIEGHQTWLPCPYGKPGDVLYTRENLRQRNGMVAYAADDTWWKGAGDYHYRYEEYAGIIPSIHMPKRAARIWDEVVSIKVERLNDISEQDAVKEGVERTYDGMAFDLYMDYSHPNDRGRDLTHAKLSFRTLWESINGAESRKLNPWLWVITTKNLSTTGKPESLCSQQK